MRSPNPAVRRSRRRTPGRRALAALHVSLIALATFTVAVIGVLVFPEGRLFLEEHFGIVRIASYLIWAIGLGGFALAPVLLLREVGAVRTFTLRPMRLRTAFDALGAGAVGRAFAIGTFGNTVVLLLSWLGLPFGDAYTWPVFCAHLILSGVVVAACSFGALIRMRDFVAELRPLPMPRRASHAAPAGGV
ncbi:MAG: hypothetical protein HYS27_14355 [Deltaproteobacteria bacterium]|nr:hypothetical protein [Deltaproteobacteria bacterium]